MVGRTISHYRIIEKLGEGGMGVVYKAWDTNLRRMVALKFLSHFALGTGHEKARMTREAQAAAALDHPNICTVYEAGEVEGETFIAMALVDGGTLRDKMLKGTLTLDETMDIAIQVAEGLAAAHRKGIVHRDIKPGNLMITSDGRAKILDFGLAMSPGCTRLTIAGTTAGTIAYMSPEQTQGADVDHRSDIWSFGVVLFEMLTGRRPFEGGHDQAVVHSILNDEPPSMSHFRPDVPESLERIAAGALIKTADKRYQSMDDVLEDLRSVGAVGVTETFPLRAPEPERENGLTKILRQWRTQLAAVATVIAVGIAGMAIYEALVGNGPPAVVPSQVDRVLVAPFENRTGTLSLNHVGRSAEESICAGLAEAGHVQVVTCAVGASGSESGQATESTAGLLRRAREEGASILVTGYFEAGPETLNMGARLLDALDGAVLNVILDERGPLAAPAVAIGRVRSRIVGALAARSDPWILSDERSYAPTWEAYKELVAGREATTLDAALEHYGSAIGLDPGFRPAVRHSHLAQVIALRNETRFAEADSLIEYGLTRPDLLSPNAKLLLQARSATYEGDYSRALGMSRELVEVEPEFPYAKELRARSALRVWRLQEAADACRPFLEQAHESGAKAEHWVYWHLLIAYHMMDEFELQLEVAREAVDAFPGDFDLLNREISALAGLGRAEEIDRIIEESMATPVGRRTELSHHFYGSWLFTMKLRTVDELDAHGHTEQAAVRAAELVEWTKNKVTADPETVWANWQLAWANYRAERWEEALPLFERLELPYDNMDMARECAIGSISARLGDRERALEIKQALLEWDMESKYYNPGLNNYFASSIAAVLGDSDEAMDLLMLALAEGNDIWDYIHFDQDYAPLRDHPAFKGLLESRD